GCSLSVPCAPWLWHASVCRTEAGKPQLGPSVGGHNISTSTTPAATPSDPYGIPSRPVCRSVFGPKWLQPASRRGLGAARRDVEHEHVRVASGVKLARRAREHARRGR